MKNKILDYKDFDEKKLGELDLSLQTLASSGKVDRVLAADIFVIARYVQSLAEKLKELEK